MPKVSNECLNWINSIDEYCPSDEKKCLEVIDALKRACSVQQVKRKPSAFNLFMRECLSRKRNEKKEHREKFKECVLEWKARK